MIPSSEKSIQRVQYGEAIHDKVNVIWWETFSGTRHWMTLTLEWYNNDRHPIDALRQYAPEFQVNAYTSFEYMEHMYEVPQRDICEGRYEDG